MTATPVAPKEDVYTLPEGVAILQWPATIGRASAEDLGDWLALVIRKIKRSADAPPPTQDDGDGQGIFCKKESL